MATKATRPTKRADTPVVPAAPSAPATDKASAEHPPAHAFVTLWVFGRDTAASLNSPPGFVRVPRADAADIIATGGAVDPATTHDPLPFVEGTEPLPWPRSGSAPPEPAPPPPSPPPVEPPAPIVVAITAFSASSPTVATASAADVARLHAGDRLTLTQTSGEPIAALDSQTGTVTSPGATTFTLTGIDLDAEDVSGVTASGTVQAAA